MQDLARERKIKYSMDKETLIGKLTPVLEKYRAKILFAYLFGSVAEGVESALSDVDIAVYASPGHDMDLDERLGFQADCCRALKRDDVDVMVLNQTRNLILKEEIVRNGIVILDQAPETRTEWEVKILHQAIDFRDQRKAVMGV